jgi:hypothetical protein
MTDTPAVARRKDEQHRTGGREQVRQSLEDRRPRPYRQALFGQGSAPAEQGGRQGHRRDDDEHFLADDDRRRA